VLSCEVEEHKYLSSTGLYSKYICHLYFFRGWIYMVARQVSKANPD